MTLLSLIVLTAVLICAYVRALAASAERRVALRESFYEAAETLANAPDDVVASEIITMLHEMGKNVRSRVLMPALFILRLIRLIKPRNGENPIVAELDSLPSGLRRVYLEAMESYLRAISYNNVLIGWVARKTVLSFLDRDCSDTPPVSRVAKTVNQALGISHHFAVI